jgi:TrmH family RNA methyltransferase
MTRPGCGSAGPRRNGFRRYYVLINKLNHPALRRIPRLAHRKERDTSKSYFIEGVRFVSEALANNAAIDLLVRCPPLLTSPHGHRVLKIAQSRSIPILDVSMPLWERLTLTGDMQGIGALVRQQWTPIADLTPRGNPLWVAIEQVNSPGNFGTLIRTCEAAGARGAILLGPSVDPYEPAAVRATMGALFHTQFARASHAEFARWKRTSRFTAIGASPHARLDYREADYRGPAVLFLGCEQRGMTREQEALCDQIVRIPMVGRSDSLNLGVAGSILLCEAFNQRHPLACSRAPAMV